MSMSAFITHEHLVFLQYTGLKDKNGREIYEGDIVEVSEHPFDRNEREPCWNGKYIVRYYPESMELVFSKYTDENEGGYLAFRMRHYAEVIGNIFENLELLEETT
ncbi:hypothetical protein C1N55_13600 [Lysinibacillus sp. SGAir0095]|nr:hypothetical protein C1N55_13600 [Lysinibacillus sp. SGAir0095]